MTTLSHSTVLACKDKTKRSHRLMRYRFIIVRSGTEVRYDISVTFGYECLTMTLPFSDHAAAYDAYLRIKRGRVTPTTLADVIEDMK